MVLDIKDFIASQGGDPKKVKESQRRRGKPESTVDEIIELFEDHRKTQYGATQIGSQINAVQKEIGQKKKNKEDASELLKKKEELQKEKTAQEELAKKKQTLRDQKLNAIGNYVHESVPVSNNEDDNAVIRTWAPEGVKVEKREDWLSHHEVLYRIDGYDPDRGAKIAGHRGYFLMGMGMALNQAMALHAEHFLHSKGYKLCQTPYFMNRDAMAKTAQLEDFHEQLYKVTEDDEAPQEAANGIPGAGTTDKYLIATSEQPLSAMHADEWMQEKDLPIKYAGYSTCFRKEAGGHGRDVWGLFRVHQFEKVEQFVFCKPEKSWEMFDEMIAVSEEFYKSLKLPYQVVAIVAGALNNAASKKYDLEAWFPFQGEYKELVSCSNCTDYQTRALEIRYGTKKQTDARKEYVHALNCTLCATERALCCVLENYQTPEGLTVPEPLRKYIPGAPEFLPYVKELPKDSTSAKKDAPKKDAGKKDAGKKDDSKKEKPKPVAVAKS